MRTNPFVRQAQWLVPFSFSFYYTGRRVHCDFSPSDQLRDDRCILLVIPQNDEADNANQENDLVHFDIMRTGFMDYLQKKQAAGIINVNSQGNNEAVSESSTLLKLIVS